MSKLEVKFTSKEGAVFNIEVEGNQFRAGRNGLNDNKLINIPDMTDSEAFILTDEERTVLVTTTVLGAELNLIDPKTVR